MDSAIFHLRQRSLARGNLLVFGAVVLAFWLSDFPHNRATLFQIIPVVAAVGGTIETARCIRRRWGLRHAAVLLCLYMDLMALTLVFFSLFYPYVVQMRSVR